MEEITTPQAIFVICILIAALLIFAKQCYDRGKMVWSVRCAEMEDQYKDAIKYKRFFEVEQEKHLTTKDKLKKAKEEARVRHNKLHTIWAAALKSNIGKLWELMEIVCKEHHKFIPDPIPNQRRGACVTKIQGDGSVGNETQTLDDPRLKPGQKW
jgi:hypothetical protein